MNLQYLLYIIILSLGIITSIIFTFLLSKNKTAPGSKLGILLVSGCIIWMAGKVLEFLSTDLQIKLLWNKIEYIGIVVIPVTYLLIVLQNTGHEKWITLKKGILFSIMPVLTLSFVFTNEFHLLFWSNVTLNKNNSLDFLSYEYGVWFWLWAAYLYISIMISYFILMQILITRFNLFRLQAGLMILVLSVPWFTNLLHIIRIKPFIIFDITPLTLVASIYIIIFGFTRLKIFNIIPIAHKIVVDSIRDNIIVLDNKNRILYLNSSAKRIFKYYNTSYIGEPVTKVLTDYYNYFDNEADSPELNIDITLANKKGKRNYNMIISPIIYGKENLLGKVIVLRDTTEQRQIEESLHYRVKFENLITTLSTKFINLSLGEIDDGINYALKIIGEFTNVSRSYIFLIYDHGTKIDNTHEWCTGEIEPKIKKLKGLTMEIIPRWLKKLENFEPVYIPDVSRLKLKTKKEKKMLKLQGIKSIIAIPMIYEETLIGLLGFESMKTKKIWTKNDITLLKLLGEILANALRRKKAEEEIQYLFLKDKLTRLYNRAYFEEELKRLDTKRQLPLSFIIGDLVGLKLINDAFGLKEGDRLLRKVARILKSCCREEDIVARWGGDEFSILLPKTTEKDSEEILNRIRTACLKTGDEKIPLSISLGISTKKDYDCDIRTIVKEAEDRMYRRKLLERKSISSSIISSLERTLQEKNYETKEHAIRLKEMALILGRSLKLPENKLNELSLLSTLHDIGKIAIPDEILMKKDKLTKKEWEIVKRHPEVGYNICSSSPQLATIADAVLSHHEWWNGNGYPHGLKGKNILLVSRIISIVDAYDVMTHDRSYRRAIRKEIALEELKRCAGTQFDPNLVKIFIQVLN